MNPKTSRVAWKLPNRDQVVLSADRAGEWWWRRTTPEGEALAPPEGPFEDAHEAARAARKGTR